MRLLFLSTPQTAHLDWGGYLATAQRLAEQGHTVLWASGEAVAPQVAAASLPFAPLAHTGWIDAATFPPIDPTLDVAAQRMARQRRSFDAWLSVHAVAQAAREIECVARDFAPDAIVSEMFCLAAAFVAERLNLPLVVAGWPAIDTPPSQEPLSQEMMARLQELCRRLDCSGRNLSRTMPAMQSPNLHITWWNERWYAGIPVLPQTRHAGGIAPPPLSLSLSPPSGVPSPDDRPWVLITLGTTFHRDLAFFRMAAQAAVNLGCLPLVVHGALDEDERAALADVLPPLAHLTPRVDFAAVLPWTVAAVHHGGAGTTHALVTHAVPQMVVPHAGDQGFQARAVARVAVGVHCPVREMTVDKTERVLSALLPDRSPFRTNAANLKQEFAALGGVARSAELTAGVTAGFRV